jgi:hypothetical protein
LSPRKLSILSVDYPYISAQTRLPDRSKFRKLFIGSEYRADPFGDSIEFGKP